MPTSGRQAARSTREGRGDWSEAEGAARLGRSEAAVAVLRADSKGQSRGRRRATQGPQARTE
ncbi:hypothetical protein EXE44_16445 [Halorubrum sp. SS7]|nr:hypothetical protein EXE44_16445 [Halorubrum sp. SS7]